MTEAERRALERNIISFSWSKIFTKRVFLPLIAIQLVREGGVTPEQIGMIAVFAAIVQMVLQVPAGYVADKFGNRFAILLGCIIATPSPLFYIVMPGFAGGMIASALFFGGWSFQSGALEAFMHDTLKALGKERQYTKIMGRAQSYGLVGNMVLVTAVPATYTINHNLPFFLGFLSLCAMTALALTFHFPKEAHTDTSTKHPLLAMKHIVTRQNAVVFLFAGIMAGIATRGGEYRELLFESVGIAVSLYGLILSSSSVVGALLGRFLHAFDRVSSHTFYFFDFTFMSACLMIAGVSRSPMFAIAGMVLFTGYSRVRLIVYQSKLLEEIAHSYKATLLSALNFFNVAGEILAIAALAKLVGLYDYTLGYLYFSFFVFGVGMILWFAIITESKQSLKHSNK